MASLRAALLLLPALSVVVAMAARGLSRKLSALARSQLACLPSSGGLSFRYLVSSSSSSSVEDIKCGAGELPVALYYRNRRTMSWRPGSSGGEVEQEDTECVFCLSVIEEGSEVRELRCRHLFHRGCLDRWVPVSATCPLCRGRLLELAAGYYYDDDEEEAVDSDSDLMLFMACVHSSSRWLWPS